MGSIIRRYCEVFLARSHGDSELPTDIEPSARGLRVRWATGLAAVLGFVMALGNCLAAGSLEEPFDEYQVKAAFLYNFAKFVQWPSATFQSANEPIAICVLGQDPFGRSLEDTVTGRAIEGRSLIVRHISSVKQAAGCHILFIGSPETKQSAPVLSELRVPWHFDDRGLGCSGRQGPGHQLQTGRR